MGRLVLFLLLSLVLGLVGAVCFVITLGRMARACGWRRALVGLVCPPVTFAWGWGEGAQRHGRFAVGLGTTATVVALLVSVLLDASMG